MQWYLQKLQSVHAAQHGAQEQSFQIYQGASQCVPGTSLRPKYRPGTQLGKPVERCSEKDHVVVY